MRIIDDGKGKYIVDFEGLKLNVEGDRDSGLQFLQQLFNFDVVSEIRNGDFRFVEKAISRFSDVAGNALMANKECDLG